MTELDKRLQQIAATNWGQFVKLIGEDALLSAKVCLLRGDKKSYGEISIRLDIGEGKARYRCNPCVEVKANTEPPQT